MTVTEKAAYIKGLAEGLGLDENNKQDKILKELIDLVSDIALTTDDLDAAMDEVYAQIDEIDEDLADLEDEVYSDECDDDCDCGDCDGDDDFIEVQCPACGSKICIDSAALEDDDQIICPNCKTELDFSFDEEDDSKE